MRKDILIESVRKAVLRQSANTQDSIKFTHPMVIEGEVAKAYDQLLKTYYSSNVALMNAELDFYAKKYTVAISESNGVKYINLPAQPIGLKNNLGIRYVRPNKGKFSFVRVSDTELEILRDLEIYCCSKKAFYYLDGGKIVFDFPIHEYSLIPSVDIKLLPIFSEFDDTDNIDFPTGGKAPTDMVLETMGFRPTDNINDDAR